MQNFVQMCQILEECIRTNKKMIDERSCYRIPSRGSKMREADRLPIGSSATCASSYRSRQTPTDHAQSFSRRIVDINPVSHAKSSTRAHLFCTQPLLPFSLRFRKPISTLLAIRRPWFRDHELRNVKIASVSRRTRAELYN